MCGRGLPGICAAAARIIALSARSCGRRKRAGGSDERDLTARLRRRARRHHARLHVGSAARLRAAASRARLPGSLDDNRLLDAWIRIGTDGNATVCTGKVELGQGIVTALAQIAAEELDLPLDRVQMISGDTEKTPNEGVTAGSQSIENSGTALRLAGAQVRAILLELAAKRLGADAAALSVTEGVDRRAGRAQAQLCGACRRGRSASRGNRASAAEARVAAPDRRQADRAARHPGKGHGRRRLCAGPAAARNAAWPDRATAGLWSEARRI